jgi:hypothetical protein
MATSRRKPGKRQRHSKNSAHEPQRHALPQQFCDDPPLCGAQGRTNREFLLPAFGAHQQKICDIRRCDQQHDSESCH